MRPCVLAFPIAASALLAIVPAAARALTIGGVDTDAVLASLTAGAGVSPEDVAAITAVSIELLTLEELRALQAVLRALQSANHDVAAQVIAVDDRIAFLESVAEDLPIPASPT